MVCADSTVLWGSRSNTVCGAASETRAVAQWLCYAQGYAEAAQALWGRYLSLSGRYLPARTCARPVGGSPIRPAGSHTCMAAYSPACICMAVEPHLETENLTVLRLVFVYSPSDPR